MKNTLKVEERGMFYDFYLNIYCLMFDLDVNIEDQEGISIFTIQKVYSVVSFKSFLLKTYFLQGNNN